MRIFQLGILLLVYQAALFSQCPPKIATPAQTADKETTASTDTQLSDKQEYWKKEKKIAACQDKLIDLDLENSNGIVVMEPQLYDNALLQRMLVDAHARLSLLNVIDQSTITSRIGAPTGSSTGITNLGGRVQASPPTGSQSSNNSEPQPSTFPSSASDTLNEQMQLSDQIANLSLLLEVTLSGSLMSDSGDVSIQKPKITIGVPVMIAPGKVLSKRRGSWSKSIFNPTPSTRSPQSRRSFQEKRAITSRRSQKRTRVYPVPFRPRLRASLAVSCEVGRLTMLSRTRIHWLARSILKPKIRTWPAFGGFFDRSSGRN